MKNELNILEKLFINLMILVGGLVVGTIIGTILKTVLVVASELLL